MEILQGLECYRQFIKNEADYYREQKQGLDLLAIYFRELDQMEIDNTFLQELDYFLAVWVPRRKKYLNEIEAQNVVCAVQAFTNYIQRECTEIRIIQTPIILEMYQKEYKRLYKIRKIISEISNDPVVSTNPTVVDLENYRYRQERRQKKDSMCVYEQGLFRIEEVSPEGYISLVKLNGGKYFKILCNKQLLQSLKVGDLMNLALKRKMFFSYWEIEELKIYYLSTAKRYL